LAVWLGKLRDPQLFETEDLIRNWFEGHGYVFEFLGTNYRSFHSVLPYDALYALVYGLSGGRPWAQLVVQWLFAALLCLVVWRLGTRLGGPLVGALGAWLAALHPGLLAYDATRGAQFHLDGTLVVSMLLACVRWAEAPSARRAAAAGTLTALVMYERGTMGLFCPLALAWVRRVGQPPWRRYVTQVALYGALAVALVLPWMIRNA